MKNSFTALLSPMTADVIERRAAAAMLEKRFGPMRASVAPATFGFICLVGSWQLALAWFVLLIPLETWAWVGSRRLVRKPDSDSARTYLVVATLLSIWWSIGGALLWMQPGEAAHYAALALFMGAAVYAYVGSHHEVRLLIGTLFAPAALLFVLPAANALNGDLIEIALSLFYATGVAAVLVLAAVISHLTYNELVGARRAAQANTQRLEFAIRASGAVVWELDFVEKRLIAGDDLNALFGVEMTYDQVMSGELSRVHPEHRKNMQAMIETILAENASQTLEYRIRMPGDEVRWLRTSGQARRNAQGGVIGIILMSENITERMRRADEVMAMQSELQSYAARMAMALTVNQSAVFEMDHRNRLIVGGEALETLLGRPVTYDSFLSPEGAAALMHGDDLRRIARKVLSASEHETRGQLLEFRVLLPGGGVRWISMIGMHERDQTGAIVRSIQFIRVIDEQKARELEVQAAREKAEADARRFGLVLEAGDAVVWELDFEKRTLEGAAELERFLGFPVNYETFADNLGLFVHPEEIARVSQEIAAATAKAGAFKMEHRLPPTGDEDRWVEVVGRGKYGADGALTGYLVMTSDITGRRLRARAFVDLMREAEEGLAARRPLLLAEASQAGAAPVPAAAVPKDEERALGGDWVEELFVRLARMTDEIQTRESALIDTVAALKAARRDAERQALIASQGADAVVITDARGRIEWVNHAFEVMTEYRLSDVYGKSPGSFLQGALTDSQTVRHISEALRARCPIAAEILNYAKSGRQYWLDLTITPVFNANGGLEHFIAVQRDVTARKQMEANLEAALQEARVAREGAEQANAEKSRFLANMSHELRTPLNAVIGYAEILEEELTEFGAGEAVKDVTRIKTAGRHLLHLINDVLDLSKIEAGKMEVSADCFEVRALFEEVTDTVRPAVTRNGNRFLIDAAGTLGKAVTDSGKLKQCLFNLLSNAAKFTKDGDVAVAARREQSSAGDMLVFEVRDSGIGMSPEQLARLFSPFAQADSSIAKRFGGTGLGLSLTRSLARLLGGDVVVASELGKGSVFTLSIPVALNATPDDLELEDYADDKPIIVVIEDEPAARDLIMRSVARLGFALRTAENGRSGLDLVRKLKPCCVILDINLPDIEGWEVLQVIKADPDLSATPIIVCTVEDDRNKAVKLGAVEHLVKPTDRGTLAAAVVKHAKTRLAWNDPEKEVHSDAQAMADA